MTSTRLRPIVQSRGFGAARLRRGGIVYVVLLALMFAGFAMGTVAMADVVRSAMRAS